MREITFRGIILAIILTIILATSNAYLALKLGILTSASIPAAIISMGILRFFKNSSILENNAIQTAASAGEAVAGGICYTIPALIIIGFWHNFDYITNFLIAFFGGILGVLFSIPLRKVLVAEQHLPFPEGRAIAQVLQTSYGKLGLKEMGSGALIGALFELLQNGFKILSSGFNHGFSVGKSIFSIGAGFSAALIGAGFIIGFEMTFSIFLGAVISWGITLPTLSIFNPIPIDLNVNTAVNLLWNTKLRYFGIGGMLCAGIWTFLNLLGPLLKSIASSWQFYKTKSASLVISEQQDISLKYILLAVGGITVGLYLFFLEIFPLDLTNLSSFHSHLLIVVMILYILIVGFIFSVITAFFSGMVGVSASPGSSIVIAGILFVAWLLLLLLNWSLSSPLPQNVLVAGQAVTIIIGSIVTGIAAIANDNIQDLKVGHIVKATPWKQELMLMLGVLVAALVIPLVMQLLFEVYGIGTVIPMPDMDLNDTLPAPVASLLAAVSGAVFSHELPLDVMLLGSIFIIIIIVLASFLKKYKNFNLSPLGVAIGMYLPVSSSVPLFIGGFMTYILNRRLQKRSEKEMLIACGLVTGAALMDVFLAIPFSIMKNPNVLALVGNAWEPYAIVLSVLSLFMLFWFMYRSVT